MDELEVGLMFWGGADPQRMVRAVKSLGLRCGHLGITTDVPVHEVLALYREVLRQEDFTVTAVFAAFEGESYADIPTVQRTVGFVPLHTRAEREQRTYRVIDFAAALGVPIFACHIGYVPENSADPDFVAMRDLVRRICDYTQRRNMTFAMETGQETPAALKHFLLEVGRPNLKLNFDPANIVLYGTGEPIAALEELAEDVVSVHCKDGIGPVAPGELGTEMPLGQGAVGMEKFVRALKRIGYRGPLTIEREVSLEQDKDDRHQATLSHVDDIRAAIELLRRLALEQ